MNRILSSGFGVAAVALVAALAAPAQGLELQVETLAVPGPVETLELVNEGPRLMIGAGGKWHSLGLAAGGATLTARPEYRGPGGGVLPQDGLPHSRVALGARDIAAAWLAQPTDRYPHGVLGDRLEGARLRVRARDGRSAEIILPDEAVFEDLTPRLVDLDGQGHDSILVVRSTRTGGAALVAYRLGALGLEERAATPPIGAPNRWLNPVGVADLDGDGRPELALVVTPHIGGVLKIYSWTDGRFVERASAPGFSNHDIGSTQLALHALGDFDGDGIVELALRGQDRRTVEVMSFAGGRLVRLGTIRHEAAVVGPMAASDLDGDGRAELVYGLADGRLAVVRTPGPR